MWRPPFLKCHIYLTSTYVTPGEDSLTDVGRYSNSLQLQLLSGFPCFSPNFFKKNYLYHRYLRPVRQIWRRLLCPCCPTSYSSVQILFLSRQKVAAHHHMTQFEGQQGGAVTEIAQGSPRCCIQQKPNMALANNTYKGAIQDGPAGSICLGSKQSHGYHDWPLAEPRVFCAMFRFCIWIKSDSCSRNLNLIPGQECS